MNKRTEKYLKIFKITLINKFAYIWELVFRTLFLVIILYIFSNLWKAVYETTGKTIEGFTIQDMLWYFMFTEALVISRGRPEGKIDSDVKSGNIAYTLNKPYNYLLFEFFLWLGDTLPQLIINLFIGSIVICLLIGPININLFILIPLCLILLLATIMEFFVRMTIGLSAFWIEDITMASFIYSKIIFIFGGMLLPLDFFPPLFRKISESLPFGYMVYHPAKLFVKFDWTIYGEVVKMQIIWMFVLGIICYLTYNSGVKRLNINGG